MLRSANVARGQVLTTLNLASDLPDAATSLRHLLALHLHSQWVAVTPLDFPSPGNHRAATGVTVSVEAVHWQWRGAR